MRRCGGGGEQTGKNQFLQGTPDFRGFTVIRSLDVRRRVDVRWLGEIRVREEHLGFMMGRTKFIESERFRGWKRWRRRGKARSTQGKANPRIKSNKISSHQQITKKIRSIFCGDFRNWGRTQQNQARKRGVGALNK